MFKEQIKLRFVHQKTGKEIYMYLDKEPTVAETEKQVGALAKIMEDAGFKLTSN